MTTVLEPRTRTTAPNERDVRDTTPHRVAYVVSHYPLVSHVFVQREVRALRALGADVTVFSIHRAGPEEVLSTADAEEAAATHALLPIDVGQLTGAHRRAFLRSPRSYLATLRYALRRSPRGARAKLWQLFYFAEAIAVWDGCVKLDVRHLHAHFANVAADVAWLATDFGRRSEPDRPWHWTFTMHGCVEFWDVDRFNLARKAAAASMVLCISDFTRAQLMALTEPQYWPKLEVVHCGVDLDQYSPSTRPDRDGRPVELLTVGRLSPEKGLLVLLEAVAQLHRDGVGVRLTIVGDGPLRDELFAYAAEAGIDGIVTFAGSVGQDDMPSYFDAADVFCQPSFNEGIPVVLMEAMASGLPVVGSAVGAIAELVADRHSGLLVTAARAGALADALRHLVESPQLRATMGTRGREIVERDFDTAALARRIDRLFRELADGARMVPPEREPGPTTRLW